MIGTIEIRNGQSFHLGEQRPPTPTEDAAEGRGRKEQPHACRARNRPITPDRRKLVGRQATGEEHRAEKEEREMMVAHA